MGQPSVLGIIEHSLIGRLIEFLVVLWENSLIARALAKLGELWRWLFANSYVGAVWLSNWPSGEDMARSRIGRIVGGLGELFARLGQRVSPWLTATWETSLVAGLLRRGMPILETSYIFRGYSGFAPDVALAPAESGRRAPAPELYLLGAVLGLGPVLPGGTNLMVAGVWGIAILWVVRKLMTRDFAWRASSAFVPLAVLLVIGAASTVQSTVRSSSLLGLILWVTAVLFFFLLVNLVRNSRDAAVVLGPVLVGGALLALWGMYQYVRPPLVEESWVDVETSGQLVRVFASFGNPNYLAEYMSLYLPLGLALWLQQPRRQFILAVPLGLMALVEVLTFSRGGWLALAISLVVLFVVRFRRYMVLLILGAMAFPLVAPDTIMRRLLSAFTTADTSNLYRINLWKGVQAMLGKFWFLGAGLGADAFAKVYSEFMLAGARAAHAHNTYLQMFAEMGIFGLIAVLWALFAVLRRTGVVGSDARRPLLLAAVPAALCGLLFHGLVEHIWYNPKLLFAFWAVAGLGMGLAMGEREDAVR